jgi:DNA-binding NtrC family response regulator
MAAFATYFGAMRFSLMLPVCRLPDAWPRLQWCALMTAVLLVEDETDVLEVVQDALERRGLVVRTARSDRDAYSALEGEARSFGMLIADINLGEGVTGFDVARRARQLNPDLKVVYITGHAAHLERFGVPDSVMVPKPFYPDDLAEQVIDMLGEDAG